MTKARREYLEIARASEARSVDEFNARVRQVLTDGGLDPAKASGPQWVAAARKARFMCRRCAGTGAFITYVENGQPKGPGGICFRCAGKGWQDHEDVMRNYVHDVHYLGRSA